MLKSCQITKKLLRSSQTKLINNIYLKKSSTATQTKSRQDVDDDMPVQMENPFQPRVKRCLLCGVRVDYKNVQLLSQFVSSVTGVPLTQKSSGLCDKKYADILEKIKTSRKSGFMASRTKESTFLNDPDLTDRSIYSRRRDNLIAKGEIIPTESQTKSSSQRSSGQVEDDEDSDSDDSEDIYALERQNEKKIPAIKDSSVKRQRGRSLKE